MNKQSFATQTLLKIAVDRATLMSFISAVTTKGSDSENHQQ